MYKSAIVKRVDSKIKVGITDSYRPKRVDSEPMESFSIRCEEWKRSLEWYDVKDDNEWIGLCASQDTNFLKLPNTFKHGLSQGIEVDPKLIEIKSNCCGRCDGVNDECDATKFAAIIKPESKEESEYEQLENLLDLLDFKRNGYSYEAILKNFTIKRK